jgi:uncharacterized protein (TIGR04255 family)
MVTSVERMVTQRPIHGRKPLREAVFELYANADAATGSIPVLKSRVMARLPEFTHHEEQLLDFGIRFRLGAEPSLLPEQSEPMPRFRLWDEAKKRAVQFGPHMCAYNVLGAAYTQFEDSEQNIRRVVECFLDEARPAKLAWAGQRYINAIEIPVVQTDVHAFFPIYPRLPSELHGHLPLAVQVQTETTKNGQVAVSLSLENVSDSIATYVLDIYARSVGELPTEAQAVTEWHRSIHGAVHRAFHVSLSDACRATFEEIQ